MPPVPAKRLAVVTCMDARVDPARILRLDEGDAHVIRNAGAHVTDDVLRSLEASRSLGTEEVVLMLHTDCGGRPGEDDLEAAAREAASRLGDSVRALIYDVDSRELIEVH